MKLKLAVSLAALLLATPALAVPPTTTKVTPGLYSNGVSGSGANVLASGASLSGVVSLGLVASATGGASLNIPHGTAPTSPNNGDVWTTTLGLFARINGATVGPFASSAGTTLVPGTTAISGGSPGKLLYDNTTLGEVSLATAAQIWAATANQPLEAGNVFNAAGALVSLTGTSSVAPDFSTGFNFKFTATTATNYTLANPTNIKAGQTGCIELLQPASGTVDTISWGTDWQFPGGSATAALTATLGAKDVVCYVADSTSTLFASMINNVSH